MLSRCYGRKGNYFKLQLTLTKGHNGLPSQYSDTRFVAGGQQFNPGMVAQQVQDPNNVAHPQNPQVSLHLFSLHDDRGVAISAFS